MRQLLVARRRPLVSAAIQICPLAAMQKTPWPSRSVSGLAGRCAASQPERRLCPGDGQLSPSYDHAQISLYVEGCQTPT